MTGLGIGNGDRGFGYAEHTLASGAAAGVQTLPAVFCRVDTVRRRARYTVVVSGAQLGAEVASVQLEAALLLSEDDAVWYPVAAAVLVPDAATVVLAHDAAAVGMQIRLKVTVSTVTTADIRIEYCQTNN